MTGRNLTRLQPAKYIRQLRRIDEELRWWQDNYAYAGLSTTADHLKGRFGARAAQIGTVRQLLQATIDAVYAVPRLS